MKKVTVNKLLVTIGLTISATSILLLSACTDANVTPTIKAPVLPSASVTNTNVSPSAVLLTSRPTQTAPVVKGTVPAGGTMSISIANRDIKAGDKFKVDIVIDSQTGLRGFQCGLDFDPQLMKCEDAQEGNYLKKWAKSLGMDTMMMPEPMIDNTKGHISKTIVVVSGRPEGELDNPGTGASGKDVAVSYAFVALADGVASPKITDASLIAIPQNTGRAVELPVTIKN